MPGATDPAVVWRRAGGRTLFLLADPISVSILRSLESGPMAGAALSDQVEHVSRGTYFNRMRDLEASFLLIRERRASVPPIAECRLTEAGRQLLPVVDRLEAWLDRAENGSMEPGGASATNVIKALALGWQSMLLPLLAEQPRSLTELEPLVGGFGYRKLERTAHVLVAAGLAERQEVGGRPSPYALTRWACEAVIPLMAAIRWERLHLSEHSPELTPTEAEGVKLLAALCDLDEVDEWFAL
jgi:DNA-binding HxlR family transcriptional regulator